MLVPLRRSAKEPPPRVLRAARRVALVCMPFADPRYPSIGLSLLAEATRARGHHVDIHHLHVEAAARLGLEPYYRLEGGTSWYNLTGEWLFSHPSITPGAANEAEMRAHLGPFSGHFEVDMGYFDEPPAAGGDVTLYDAMRLRQTRTELDALVDAWCDRIDFGQYDIVGFTVVFQQLNASLRLARRIKDRHPQVRIVLGGAALEPPMGDAIAERWDWLDAVFAGFSDHTFPDYVDAPDSFPRIIHHQGSPIVMDELPAPNYDDFFEAVRASGLAGRMEIRVPVEMSRGCWWGEKSHCTFCGFNANDMWFRQKSPARAYEELKSMSRYGEAVYVVDNIIPTNYFDQVFSRFRDEGFKLPGGFLFTKSNLRRAELDLLGQAGFTWVQPGIESLATGVLEHMKKGVRGVHNAWLLRACEEAEVYPSWAILYGFPGEPREDYTRMAALLPKLAHLPAPTGAYRILMARYSPIFTNSEEFGLSNVKPARAYGHAFGPHATLDRQAYTFDYTMPPGENPDEYAEDVARQAARWNELKLLPLAPRCEVFEVAGQHVLFDSRQLQDVGRAAPRLRLLTADQWHVLELLESPLPRRRLRERWPTSSPLWPVLEGLIAKGAVLEADGRLVRLAVVRQNPRLLPELLRVLKEKAKQVLFHGALNHARRRALWGELRSAAQGLLGSGGRAQRARGAPTPMI